MQLHTSIWLTLLDAGGRGSHRPTLGVINWHSVGAKNIGDKLCQSNFDKRSSDFGFFLIYLITTI